MSNFDDRSANQDLDLGLRITPKAYSFLLTAVNTTVREGDELLISYKAEGSAWTHVAMNYEKGMSVETLGRPEHVVVLTLREVEAVAKLSEASRSVFPETSFLGIGDPFAFLSLSSPFSVLHANNDPQKYLELFDLSTLKRNAAQTDVSADSAPTFVPVDSSKIDNLQPPVQRTKPEEPDTDDNTPPPRHNKPHSHETRRRDRDDDDFNRRGYKDTDPYRRNDDVIPIVIINQEIERERDRDDDPSYQPPHHHSSDQAPYSPSDAKGPGDAASTPFGDGLKKDEAEAPFGSKRDDEATALFGSDRKDDFASAPFGSREPGAYK